MNNMLATNGIDTCLAAFKTINYLPIRESSYPAPYGELAYLRRHILLAERTASYAE